MTGFLDDWYLPEYNSQNGGWLSAFLTGAGGLQGRHS